MRTKSVPRVTSVQDGRRGEAGSEGERRGGSEGAHERGDGVALVASVGGRDVIPRRGAHERLDVTEIVARASGLDVVFVDASVGQEDAVVSVAERASK